MGNLLGCKCADLGIENPKREKFGSYRDKGKGREADVLKEFGGRKAIEKIIQNLIIEAKKDNQLNNYFLDV